LKTDIGTKVLIVCRCLTKQTKTERNNTKIKMRRGLILIIAILTYSLSNAQSADYKNKFGDAEYHFLNEAYDAALKLYLELHADNPDNANLNYRIGQCYLELPYENIRSIEYLKKAVTNISANYKEGSYKEEHAPIGALFFLGYAYHLCNFLDKASEYYNRYRDTLSPSDVYNMTMVERQILSVANAKEIIKNPVDIEIQNIGRVINTADPEYNPAVSADGHLLIYTHDRPLEKRDTSSIYYMEQYHEILLTTRLDEEEEIWSKPIDITNDLNTKGQCITLSMSADGKTLLLYKDNWLDGGLTDNKAGSIYISHYDDEEERWGQMQIVHNEINTTNWETHACISPDGKSIYFASDRKGGYGGLDLYVTKQNANGTWGKAQNLGPTINTPYDETTPYILADSVTLYFSSEGHYNMGGYDVFKSKLQADGSWSTPENLGYPINSTGDNLFFVPIKDGSTAFYSVERHEGYFTFGSKDIYQIDILTEKDTTSTVAALDSLLTDSIANAVAGLNGDNINTPVNGKNDKVNMPSFKERDIYVIRNIYFEFNSAVLNREAQIEAEKLYKLLSENPSLYIEIVGHTDSKGTNAYNDKLSLQRSRAVAEYLMKRGIEKTRFVTTGLGKKDLLAKESYEGNSKTAGEKYNRRVEIKVLKSNNDVIVSIEEQIPEELRIKAYNRYSIVLSENTSKVLRGKYADIDGEVVLTMQTPEGYLNYIGNYESKADAVKKLNDVIAKGYSEAYITDYFELNKKNKFVTTNKLGTVTKYTIQLKAIDKKILMDAKLKGVEETRTKDGFYRYTYKEFTDLKAAEKVLKDVIKLGFDDAFIIEKYLLK